MCRQFTLTTEDWSDILDTYGISGEYLNFRFEPRYNIKTSENVVAIVSAGTTRRIGTMKWGLIPSWAQDPKIGGKMVNARSETILEKPSFKGLVKSKRCVVLADGYYEYQHVAAEKLPYRFCLKDRQVFGFAGLWDSWKAPNGERINPAR